MDPGKQYHGMKDNPPGHLCSRQTGFLSGCLDVNLNILHMIGGSRGTVTGTWTTGLTTTGAVRLIKRQISHKFVISDLESKFI